MNEPVPIYSTSGYKETPDRKQQIVNLLRAGATRKDASFASGIVYETFRTWMKEDSAFSVAVMMAEGECSALMSARIYQEATRRNGDWKAALEWLRRRRRDEWGDVTRIDISKLTDEQLIALLEREAEEGSGAAGSED